MLSDTSILLFDTSSLEQAGTLWPPEEYRRSRVRGARFDSSCNSLVVGLEKGDPKGCEMLVLFDVKKKEHKLTVVDRINGDSPGLRPALRGVAITGKGDCVASTGSHGHIKIWNAGTGKLTAEQRQRGYSRTEGCFQCGFADAGSAY